MAAFDGLEWLDETKALDLLRVSADNVPIIEALAASVPSYVEALTGYPATVTAGERCDDLVKQLSRFVLQLWFNPDGTDGGRLEQVVYSLAKSVKALVVSGDLPTVDG